MPTEHLAHSASPEVGPSAADQPAAGDGVGLRERSKARRRALIQRTALKMFAERGYEQTTIAEVAAAAEVAPRTVTGYFPSKLELANSMMSEIAGRLAATFAANPGANLLVIVDVWLTGEERLLDPELVRLAIAMYQANPGLGALGTAQVAEAAEVSRPALVAHTGLKPSDPLLEITSKAFGAALAAYIRTLGQRRPTKQLHARMMRYLEAVIDGAADR
jgi:AcrR family transcriptional regulator